MKKSTKGLLKAAVFFLIVAAAFAIVSFCTGFHISDFQNAVREGENRISEIGDSLPGFSELSGGEEVFEETYTEIDQLSLDFGLADSRLILWDEDFWKVSGTKLFSSFSCKKKEEKLVIDTGSRSFFSGWFGSSSDGAQLEICIPRSQVLETVTVNGGVGKLSVSDGFLTCKKLEVNSGVGEIDIHADIRKEVEIDGGVGAINLTILGEEEEFDYDIDGGLGSISINGKNFSSLDGISENHHGSRKIDIDCGVGAINIVFEAHEK